MRTASLNTKSKVPEYNDKKEIIITLLAGYYICYINCKDHTTLNVTEIGEWKSPQYL
jgi:hypothetical protein